MSESVNPSQSPSTPAGDPRAAGSDALRRAEEKLLSLKKQQGDLGDSVRGSAKLGVLLTAVLIAVAWYPTFVWMFYRWYPLWARTEYEVDFMTRFTGGDTYYSHGPLVAIVSLILCWVIYKRVGVPVERSRGATILGGLTLAFFTTLHLASVFARVGFVSGFALLPVLASLLLLWGGWPLLRAYLLPIALLVFMVPFPMDWIFKINYWMKIFAAENAVWITNRIYNIPAIIDGANVYLPEYADGTPKVLTIANACGGLRSMIALTFFGALFSLICRVKGPWRIFMLALTVPTALGCNIIRISGLNFVAHHYGTEASAEGAWFHDLSGLAMFGVALAFLFTVEHIIIWVSKRWKRGWVDERLMGFLDKIPRTTGVRLAANRPVLISWLGVVTVFSVMWAGQQATADTQITSVAEAMTKRLVVDGVTFNSRDMDLDEKSKQILEFPSYVYRRFYNQQHGRMAELLVVFSKDNRKAVHPPDVCLEGAGQGIIAKGEPGMSFDREGGEAVRLKMRELITTSRFGETVHLFVYKCGDRYTPSFFVQQAVIVWNGVLNRNNTGALIRISVPAGRGKREEAQAFAMKVAKALMPEIDTKLP